MFDICQCIAIINAFSIKNAIIYSVVLAVFYCLNTHFYWEKKSMIWACETMWDSGKQAD